MKLFRYTLAALCLAASVGCLALWGWSQSVHVRLYGPSYAVRVIAFEFRAGVVFVHTRKDNQPRHINDWHFQLLPLEDFASQDLDKIQQIGAFGYFEPFSLLWFPLWYPALVFALADVGILRIGRFTIRSALIGMTIAAALLGMVVVL